MNAPVRERLFKLKEARFSLYLTEEGIKKWKIPFPKPVYGVVNVKKGDISLFEYECGTEIFIFSISGSEYYLPRSAVDRIGIKDRILWPAE
ncbi:hypothetical protein ACFL0K_01315 [Patescibacteria group bacterium]